MDSVATLGRLLLSLALVLGLMLLLARWAKGRRGGRGTRNAEVLTVLARQPLSRNSAVAVVQVLDRAMVVGVTDGHVSLLGDADLGEVQARLERPARVPGNDPAPQSRTALTGSALSPATWQQAVTTLRERTVRRS